MLHYLPFSIGPGSLRPVHIQGEGNGPHLLTGEVSKICGHPYPGTFTSPLWSLHMCKKILVTYGPSENVIGKKKKISECVRGFCHYTVSSHMIHGAMPRA